MTVKTLYRYEREGGGITVSPQKPECEFTELVRLIADAGKMVTQDGKNTCLVIDVETADGWYEVDAPEEDENEDNTV